MKPQYAILSLGVLLTIPSALNPLIGPVFDVSAAPVPKNKNFQIEDVLGQWRCVRMKCAADDIDKRIDIDDIRQFEIEFTNDEISIFEYKKSKCISGHRSSYSIRREKWGTVISRGEPKRIVDGSGDDVFPKWLIISVESTSLTLRWYHPKDRGNTLSVTDVSQTAPTDTDVEVIWKYEKK